MQRLRTIIAAVVVFSTAVLAFAPGGVAAQPSGNPVASPPSTMRVDLVHTGGRGLEVFAIDRVLVEPLPWPGNRERAIDESNSGAYRFEVREPGGRLLFSRGYSTIFEEWLRTAESAATHRSFHESLRFPLPASPVRVSVQRRNAAQQFETAWETTVDPGGMFVDRAAPPPQSLVALEEHGAPADKVDLLLIGDGYTAQECHDAFADHAKRMIAALFAHEPFRARRRDFNVWGLCPPSPQSGVARPSTGVHRRTPVGAAYDAFGLERYVLTFDNRALRDVAAWAPYEFVTILVNAESYGGGGIFGTFSTVAARSDWADYLFVHEFGHHFAGLADEYYTSPVAYEPAAKVVEPWEPNVTALLDPGSLKWRAEVAAGTPVPTPWPKDEFEARQREFQALRKQIREQRRPESEMSALFRAEQAHATGLLSRAAHAGQVGAFQGANYDARAYYRPQIDCVMFTRDEVPFCRVCQAALTRVIDLYAGPARSE
jgi:IgA Peptidase M64/Peptidase M64 N-terminus